MDIVRWSPDERVDIPDLTAMSFLVLGEFRRLGRTVFGERSKSILRGFAVEPEAPPSSRVVIRLDNGVDPESVAFGAELVGANPEYGQIIGGRMFGAVLEGSAQQIIDFAGQPNDTYFIEMRFVPYDTSIGAADNRVFWNEATNSEYVDGVETRFKAQWEVAFATSQAGGEWITLATVVWAGATISSGDITDLRDFTLEGPAPFTSTSQESSAPDFYRGDDREGLNGINEIATGIRAVMRQVRDIKGQDENGRWNWFGRVFGPPDPDGTLPLERTKSLRSVDTVSFTIGDGVRTFGDFNGVTALDDVLTHIESITAANLPQRIEIVIKSEGRGTATLFSFTTTGTHTIGSGAIGCQLVIRSAGSGQNDGAQKRPRITVSHAGSGYWLTMNRGSIEVYGLDIRLSGGGDVNRGLFALSQSAFFPGTFIAKDCLLFGSTDATTTHFTVRCSANTQVTNCRSTGRWSIYESSVAVIRDGARFQNCYFSDVNIQTIADSTDSEYATALTFDSCAFIGKDDNLYGRPAMVDFRGAQNVKFRGCHFQHAHNENGIHITDYNNGLGTVVPKQITIEGCSFTEHSISAFHAVNGGVNGASGTGWNINIEDCSQIHIRGCNFEGHSATDAGCIRLHDPDDWSIDGCHFRNLTHDNATASSRIEAVRLQNSGAATLRRLGRISGCTFERFQNSGNANPSHYAVRAESISGWSFTGNIVRGDNNGVDVLFGANAGGALRLQSCFNVQITGNYFARWNRNVNSGRCVQLEGSSASITIVGNNFEENGGYCVTNAAGNIANVTIGNNNVISTGTNERGFSLTGVDGSFTGNTGQMTTAGTIFIRFDGTGPFCMFGNVSTNGDIDRVGVTPAAGYAEAQDVNRVNAYV